MKTEQWPRIEALFNEVAELPEQERSAFLDRACKDDPSLRREVESLVARANDDGGFFRNVVSEYAVEMNGAETPAVGDRIAHYTITSFLAEGGMGRVFRARDTKLKRDVAIKSLPEEFSRDADRRERFQREAQTLAALNHPNIGAIYGIEDHHRSRYLVLELVEGETLADRIARGALPVSEALPIAKQIAEALEAAHEKGIVHRDLKPANIKITAAGNVKVLDFGLAKAAESTAAANLSHSPTVMTAGSGVILGTAPYMSPEQAKGMPIDHRSDIFSFGIVLYEMLTAKPLFAGDTVSETIAAVLKTEPDWKSLPAAIPPFMKWLLEQCLQKDVRRRLQHIGDARIALESPFPSASIESPAIAPIPQRLPWILFAAASLAAVALALLLVGSQRASVNTPEQVRFLLDVPPMDQPVRISISPDGRTILYGAEGPEGRRVLYGRTVDSTTVRTVSTLTNIPGSWSPDSRFLSLGGGGKLLKFDVSNGSSQMIADIVSGSFFAGSSWNENGDIIFSASYKIQRVSAFGGVPVTVLDPDKELGHGAYMSPQFLPDGRHFLFIAEEGPSATEPERGAIWVGSLDSAEKHKLLDDFSMVRYASGYLLFLRKGALMAQPFDSTTLTLTGEPIRLAENIPSMTNGGQAAFAVSNNGTLIYRSGTDSAGHVQLAWFDRTGRRLENAGPTGIFNNAELSPDGRKVSLRRQLYAGVGTPGSIWVLDIATGVLSQATSWSSSFAPAVWSPDNENLAFTAGRRAKNTPNGILGKAIGSRDERVLFEAPQGEDLIRDWSSDGRYLLITERNRKLIAVETTGERKVLTLASTEKAFGAARFSPDGKWIAYQSTETGAAEIYTASFPEFQKVRQISAGGGGNLRWQRDGKELFFVTGGKLMSVDVRLNGSALETTSPKTLFDTKGMAGADYDVSANGQRFLMRTPVRDAHPTPITVVVNWTAGLKNVSGHK